MTHMSIFLVVAILDGSQSRAILEGLRANLIGVDGLSSTA